MATLVKGHTFGAAEEVTNTKLNNLVDNASISGIVNADIDASADIAVSKIDLSGDATFSGLVKIDDNGSNGICLEIDNGGTDHALFIQQQAVLAAGNQALKITSNQAQINENLVLVQQDNASSTAGCMVIDNDGTGIALSITADGVLAADKNAFYVYSNAAQVNSPLVFFEQDNASSTQQVLKLQNDGTGRALDIDQNGDQIAMLIDSAAANPNLWLGNTGNGAHLRLTGDPTVATPSDGDMWYTGSALNFYNGSATTDLLGGLVKAWVVFDGTDSDPITKKAGYNIDSTITKNGTGDYTINWDTNFSSAYYAIAGMAIASGSGGAGDVDIKEGTTPSAGSVNITVRNDSGTKFDSSFVSVMAIGTQ